MAQKHQSKRLRKVILAIGMAIPLLTSTLPVSTLSAANADIDAEYRDPNESGEGYQIVVLKDRIPLGDFSFLMPTGPGYWVQPCNSMSDGNCAGSNGSLFYTACLLYTSPSPRDRQKSRMPSSA